MTEEMDEKTKIWPAKYLIQLALSIKNPKC